MDIKKAFKAQSVYFIFFFALYFFALYFLVYRVSGLWPFQYNYHFASNVIASLLKRYLSEVLLYGFLFYIILYLKKWRQRLLLLVIFWIFFLINLGAIGYYFFTHTNFQFYILQGFEWSLCWSFFSFKIILLAIAIVLVLALSTIFLLRVKPKNPKFSWPFASVLFVFWLFVLLFPSRYDNNVTLFGSDTVQKKYYRNVELEKPGFIILKNEIRYEYFRPPVKKFDLTAEELKWIQGKGLEASVPRKPIQSPKKIILVVLESYNQTFLSRYNSQIPGTTPYLDALFKIYPHIDNFYPSGVFTIHGLSALLCGHTNMLLTTKDSRYECLPELLKKAGFKSEFIRGFSKYYIGENTTFDKFGFDAITAKEELTKKYPEFIKDRPGLYDTWGYSDNYLFDEAIDRLKAAKKDDRLFLTVLTVDTHVPGGRCYAPKTESDPQDPVLFSSHCLDGYIKGFMDRLQDENLLNKDLLVIFTADHLYPSYNEVPGDGMQTSFAMKPGKIPLLMVTKISVALKAKEGAQTDIPETILDWLNLPVPKYYMGKSLIENAQTFPMGQDRQFGYLLEQGQFHGFDIFGSSTAGNEESEGFQTNVATGSPEEIIKLADQKTQEWEADLNTDQALFKWYFNRYFLFN